MPTFNVLVTFSFQVEAENEAQAREIAEDESTGLGPEYSCPVAVTRVDTVDAEDDA